MTEAVMTTEVKRNRIHPQMLALWIAMASMLMLFGAFTSAYMVRQAAGNWLEFRIPDMFYVSTAVIIGSSFLIEGAFRAFVNGKEVMYKAMLSITFLAGLLFIVLQYAGWLDLYEIGVELTGNPSGSFFYVISLMHVLHVLGGLTALVVALIHAFGLPYKVNARRRLRFRLVVQYWHFLGALWIYLFFFLLMQ